MYSNSILIEETPHHDPTSLTHTIAFVPNFEEPTAIYTVQPYISQEQSEMTAAIPSVAKPSETSLTLGITESAHTMYSKALDKVFTSAGSHSVWQFHHPAISAGQFIRMAVNYTSDRLIQRVVKTCPKNQHRLLLMEGVECVLAIDSEGCPYSMEWCRDPVTNKLSVKIWPSIGTTSTQLRVAFNCLNSCESSKQDLQWVVLSHLCSPTGLVLQRAVNQVKVVVRPKAEMIREEEVLKRRMEGIPGRGRKRTNVESASVDENQITSSQGIDQNVSSDHLDQRRDQRDLSAQREVNETSSFESIWSTVHDDEIECGGDPSSDSQFSSSCRQDLENKIIGQLKSKSEQDLRNILFKLRKEKTGDFIKCFDMATNKST